MSVTENAAIYDDLLDLLAESANEKRVLSFRLSKDKQTRLDELDILLAAQCRGGNPCRVALEV